ncbi:MAG: response regulator [Proteobacteria bacterium]|uniref:ATP-binding protein n=1 Tax=Aquabacterium sp. TaxID=1872578 RepID=UPI0035C7209B|nr:response regulator [Pseudomonadota bacterium]
MDLGPSTEWLDGFGMGWLLSDSDGRVWRMGPHARRWLGDGVLAPGHAGWASLVHPHEQATAVQAWGKPGPVEQRWRQADGQWRWFEHRLQTAGEHTLHLLTDIHERKRHESWLNDQAALLESLRRHLPGVFYKLEADERGVPHVTFVSEAVRELYELEPEAVEQDITRIFERVHPDDAERFHAIVAHAMKTEEDTAFEFRVVLPQRGVRHILGRACTVKQSGGRHTRYGYQYDITEHKLLLDAQVQVQAAEQASEAKSEFLSRMSHELRTPLNAVLGFSQLLKLSVAEPLGAEQWGRVDVIERAGRHLLDVVNDVLDLSRIEGGHTAMTLEPVPVREVFEQALGLVSSMASERSIDVQMVANAALGGASRTLAVQADRLRLQQVLVNLLTNAIKYNRPHGWVCLRAEVTPQGVSLTVQDNGQGMSLEQQSHLFEPFNRLGAEQTEADGTGIGLVIVRRLVELMGGRIDVRSQAGQGTEVVVQLPQAELPSVAEVRSGGPNDMAPPGRDTIETRQTSQVSILCVEDNEANIDLLQSIMGFRPAVAMSVARSGAQALEMALQERPDLVLIDMHLGDMSGLELASRLDRDVRTEGIPRVALSADAMSATIREAQARGFLDYITKPVDVRFLLAALDRIVEGLPPR